MIDYIQVGPKCNLKCALEREAEENQTQIHKGGGGTIETDIGVMWSQEKEC